MTRRCLTPEQRHEIANKYAAGSRFGELAIEYEIGTSTLWRVLKELQVTRNDLKLTGKSDIRKKLTLDQECAIVAAYKAGMSSVRLANKFKCTGSTILKTLKAFGIEIRQRGPVFVSKSARRRISEAAKLRWQNEEVRRKYLPLLAKIAFQASGKPQYLNPNNKEYRLFRSAILERDGNKCLRCGSTKRLHVHHKKDRRESPELVYDPGNVETLCASCHMKEEAARKRSNTK